MKVVGALLLYVALLALCAAVGRTIEYFVSLERRVAALEAR